ncbi:MAG: hypothetical protein ACI83D_000530 [Planctomycetota bacterium]|jgi:hypothetical protein
MHKSNLITITKTIIMALIVMVGIGIAQGQAWSNPTNVIPPGNNPELLMHTGAANQQKGGQLRGMAHMRADQLVSGGSIFSWGNSTLGGDGSTVTVGEAGSSPTTTELRVRGEINVVADPTALGTITVESLENTGLGDGTLCATNDGFIVRCP